MKGIYLLLLVVAVFAARSASQTQTRSGPPPRRGGHPAVMRRPPKSGAAPASPSKRRGGGGPEAEVEREGGRRRAGGRRRGSAVASARPGAAAAAAPPAPPAPPATPAPPPAQRPCNIAPVCGSDGYTYMSECFLWAGATKACDGFCPCPAAPAPPVIPARPPKRYQPPPPPCNCPTVWAPVCGVDGQTYENDCLRRCNFVNLDCDGSCPCSGGRQNLNTNNLIRSKTFSGPGIKTKTRDRQFISNKSLNSTSRLFRPGEHQAVQQSNRNAGRSVTLNPENTRPAGNIKDSRTIERKGIPVYTSTQRDNQQTFEVNHITDSINNKSNSTLYNSQSNPLRDRPSDRSRSSIPTRERHKNKSRNGNINPNFLSDGNPSAPKDQTLQNNREKKPNMGRRRDIQNGATFQSTKGIQQQNMVVKTAARLNYNPTMPRGRPQQNKGTDGNAHFTTNTKEHTLQVKPDRELRKGRKQSIQGSGRRGSRMITRNFQTETIVSLAAESQRKLKSSKNSESQMYTKKKSGTNNRPVIGRPVSLNLTSQNAYRRRTDTKVKSGLHIRVEQKRQGSRPVEVSNATNIIRENTNKTKTYKTRNYVRKSDLKDSILKRKNASKAATNRQATETNESNKEVPRSKLKQPENNNFKKETLGNKTQARKINKLSQTKSRSSSSAQKQSPETHRRYTTRTELFDLKPTSPKNRSRCLCPGFYKQVCGEDGKTYKNSCRMKCSGAVMACEGQCPCTNKQPPTCEDSCPTIYRPVCSVDAVTFNNDCLMRCSRAAMACEGPCPCTNTKPPTCEDSCPKYYSPVCSVDAITYDNDCLMRCSRKAKACEGACPCPTTPRPMVCEDYCPSVYNPVCTTDGNTYGNDCRRRCSGKPKSCDSACPCPTPAPLACEDLCPRSYTPVCAVNSQTFNSDCLRRCSGIPKDCDGLCPCKSATTTPAPLPCEAMCLQDYTPVCSKDGKTFSNDCLRKCSGALKGCDGPCPCRKAPPQRSCEDRCQIEYEPVCSIEETTFNNDCLRHCSGVPKACDGTCPCPVMQPLLRCEELCPHTYNPVCTVDGNTYNNDCLRNCSGKAKQCDGACPCKRTCEDYCPMEYKPECGLDGRTYNHECLRVCSNVAKQCDGACPCPPPKTCEDYCPTDYQPVCTEYGNTYNNDCLRKCSGERRQCEGSCPCEHEAQQVQTLSCKQQCWWASDPVCTTDGETVWSSCEAWCEGKTIACTDRCPCS